MEWLNNPDKAIEPDGACVIRICPSKNLCDGYLCWALYCGTDGS